MRIRDLEFGDIPTLVRWLQEFHNDFEFPGKRPINNETASEFFYSFVHGQNSEIAIIAEQDGKPIATFGAYVLFHPWSGVKLVYKAFWYSSKPGAGLELLRYMRDISKADGAEKFIVSSMTPQVSRLLEREGFLPTETNYVMDFKGI